MHREVCQRLYCNRASLSSLVLQAHALFCSSVQHRSSDRRNWQDGTVFPEDTEGIRNLRLQLHTRNRYVVYTLTAIFTYHYVGLCWKGINGVFNTHTHTHTHTPLPQGYSEEYCLFGDSKTSPVCPSGKNSL